MKVMVLGKATERSEAGEFGTAEEFAAMDQFNEKLVEAGVVLAADGLQPTSKGKGRLRRRRQHHGDRRPGSPRRRSWSPASRSGGRLDGRGRVDQALAVARHRGRTAKGPRR